MADHETEAQQSPEQLTLYAGILLFLLVILTIAGWLMLGGYVLGISSFFASFLFLWYWATVEKAEFSRLPASIIGALVGLGLAWQYQLLSAHYGQSGMIAGLAVICLALFIQIMNWLPIAVNPATMLFLTVLAAPALLTTINFVEVTKAIVLGAAFFTVVVYLAKLYVDAQAKAKAQPAKAT